MAEYSPGLEGVIAGETAICSITEEGLFYRGYFIGELAERCSYEEVAYLLLRGELPSRTQLAEFAGELASHREPAMELRELVRRIPWDVAPMDALRSAVSLHAHFDPEVGDGSHEANVRKTVRLLAQVPALIGTWHAARSGGEPVPVDGEGSHAAYLLRQVTGEAPDAEAERAMNVSLILYAEHEYNASAFAGRVVVSTLSDLHSGIVAGIGALKGPLHGGANEAAMEMLLQVGNAAHAEEWVRTRLERKERIMGFGHRVVRKGDTRAGILRDLGAELARKRGDTRWLDTADTIQRVVEEEKGLKPNVDFPCAWVYYMLGLPVDLYTPLFVASRVVGWAAHIIEQLDNNRLIRPRGLYVGAEPRPVPALSERP
jgi:2-methylcitrate synthase/citrate synthase II